MGRSRCSVVDWAQAGGGVWETAGRSRRYQGVPVAVTGAPGGPLAPVRALALLSRRTARPVPPVRQSSRSSTVRYQDFHASPLSLPRFPRRNAAPASRAGPAAGGLRRRGIAGLRDGPGGRGGRVGQGRRLPVPQERPAQAGLDEGRGPVTRRECQSTPPRSRWRIRPARPTRSSTTGPAGAWPSIRPPQVSPAAGSPRTPARSSGTARTGAAVRTCGNGAPHPPGCGAPSSCSARPSAVMRRRCPRLWLPAPAG